MKDYCMLLLLALLPLELSAQTTTTLKDGWEFSRIDDAVWQSATVPGTIHTDLMAHHLIPDPFVGMNEKSVQWVDKVDWQYRTHFYASESLLSNDVVELEFQGLDTYADIYVNNALVDSSHNMFVAKIVNVKKWLRAGDNELRILFHSPIKHDMPQFMRDDFLYPAGNDQSDIPLSIYARKAPYHYGWDWGPRLVTSGIWRPVLLRGWSKAIIRDVQVQQLSLTDELAKLNLRCTIETATPGEYNLRATAIGRDLDNIRPSIASLTKGTQVVNLGLVIDKPKRWWPNGLGEQPLYSIDVDLSHEAQSVAVFSRHVGLRTIEVVNAPDSAGVSFYVKVNGKPVFMKGADYIPQDNFLPRVTPDQYNRLFEDMKASHFNMVRVWGGGIYENDQFYDLADRDGILVWQDFLFACSLYPSDKAFLDNVQEEVEYNIARLRNHPSLALWCGNNEIGTAIDNWGWQSGYSKKQWDDLLKGYDQLFNQLLPKAVKQLDPDRFYFASSPISNWGTKKDFTIGDNHYWGVWHGMAWFDEFNTHVPRFMSEYGFQSFPELATVRAFASKADQDIYTPTMLSHQKSTTRGNTAINTYLLHYYKQPKDFSSWLYVNQVLQAEGMKVGIEAHRRAMPYCMGTLYWQLNDVWPGPSWSSRDYYGRWKALQYFVKKAYTSTIVSNIVKNGQLQTWIVADTTDTVTLEMELMDMKGKVTWHKSEPGVQVKEEKPFMAFGGKLPVTDSGKVILYTKLLKNNKLLTDNVFYFVPAKMLALPEPGVKVSVAEVKGQVTLTVTAAALAKNVYLWLDKDPDAKFSDNYFDLLPGKGTTITLHTTLSVQEVKEQIREISLIDTFKK
jgi:beta-mannosidase